MVDVEIEASEAGLNVDSRGVTGDVAESNYAGNLEQEGQTLQNEIQQLKVEKMVKKCAFTKQSHKLLELLEEELPSRRQVNKQVQNLSTILDETLQVVRNYMDCMKQIGDKIRFSKLNVEIEELSENYDDLVRKVNEYLHSRADEESSKATSVVSEKLQRKQKEEIEARVKTDQIRAAMKRQEEQFEKLRQQMEAEYREKISQMDALCLQEKQRLQLAEEELEYKQKPLQKQMVEELGVK